MSEDVRNVSKSQSIILQDLSRSNPDLTPYNSAVGLPPAGHLPQIIKSKEIRRRGQPYSEAEMLVQDSMSPTDPTSKMFDPRAGWARKSDGGLIID